VAWLVKNSKGISMSQKVIERISDEELALRGLPEVAYVENRWNKSKGASPVIAVKRGESGYYPIFTNLTADELNEHAGVSLEQREAMYNGSLFGWHVPGADPKHPLVQKVKATQGV
jgi:hypothetical protein